MLREVSTLKGLTVSATDGEIGSVYDVYFDAKHWTVRYFVVDTGSWLAGRRVLVSPMSLRVAGVVEDRLNVRLSKTQVEQAPSWDTEKPVSRQHEIAYAQYYDHPYYWTGPARWGGGWDPLLGAAPLPRVDPVEEEIRARERESADPNLHSARDVMGYYVQAADDDVGHVEDFLVDPETWAIRYIVVDTRNWLPGRKVVLSPAWIQSVNWNDSRVHVDLSRREVETAPAYDPRAPLGRPLEARLHEHYRRPTYWDEERVRR
jgi:sporulation protein YlmC with PRC-barrel domain